MPTREPPRDVPAVFDIKTIIMLNCGATVNLEKLFDQSQATIFVVDSHRPVHLRNSSPGRVVVLDGTRRTTTTPLLERTSTRISWSDRERCGIKFF